MIARASTLSSVVQALTLCIDSGAAASRTEHEQVATDRVPAGRMRARLSLDRFQVLEPRAVEAADDARVTDRYVQAAEVGVVHDHVGNARKRQALQHLAAV